jgi:hypothetical protein
MIKLFFMLFLAACYSGQRSNCVLFDVVKKQKAGLPILYIDSLVNTDSCIYTIGSTYLFDIYDYQFYFDGNNGYVKLSPKVESFELFFSTSSSSSKLNKVNIHQYDWIGDDPAQQISETHAVLRDSVYRVGNEDIVKITIKNLATAFPEIGVLDAVLFFSVSRGFLGSFYLDPHKPTHIIEKRGDILEEIIDYSKYEFRVIL